MRAAVDQEHQGSGGHLETLPGRQWGCGETRQIIMLSTGRTGLVPDNDLALIRGIAGGFGFRKAKDDNLAGHIKDGLSRIGGL